MIPIKLISVDSLLFKLQFSVNIELQKCFQLVITYPTPSVLSITKKRLKLFLPYYYTSPVIGLTEDIK